MPTYNFVKDILIPYMRECSADKRISTQKTEICIANHLEKHFDGMLITFADTKHKNAINGSKVREYREKRKAAGINPLTIKRELCLASKACNYAISEWDFAMPNPFARRTISDKDARAVSSVDRKRVITQAEQSALSLAAEPLLREIIEFAINTGLRLGEILRLRWDQLVGDEIHFKPEQQKNGRQGKRGMNAAALAVVNRQPEGSPLVFTRGGKAISKRWLQRRWEEARARANLPDVKFKDMRKTCGSRMLAAGNGRMEDVKTQLGHSDIRTTQSAYATDSIDNAKAVLNRI